MRHTAGQGGVFLGCSADKFPKSGAGIVRLQMRLQDFGQSSTRLQGSAHVWALFQHDLRGGSEQLCIFIDAQFGIPVLRTQRVAVDRGQTRHELGDFLGQFLGRCLRIGQGLAQGAGVHAFSRLYDDGRIGMTIW